MTEQKVWLKLKTPINEKPYIAQKRDGVETKYESVKGNFKEIRFVEGEYNGAKTFAIEIDLDSDLGNVTLQMNITNAAESIVNALAGSGKLGMLEFSPYQDNGYARVKVTNNWEKTPWKYAIDELKALKKTVTVNGQNLTDRTELNVFFKDVVIPAIQEENESRF